MEGVKEEGLDGEEVEVEEVDPLSGETQEDWESVDSEVCLWEEGEEEEVLLVSDAEVFPLSCLDLQRLLFPETL